MRTGFNQENCIYHRVENHYSNWCVWKKFYLESSEDRTGIINNMITAVCFDCEDFDRAFYFTSGDIEKIIKKDNPDEQINMPRRYGGNI